MDSTTLNEIIQLALRNDQQSFRKIVECYQSKIYTLSFRLLCNEEDAKDVVQETFIRVWMNLSNYHPDKEFSTWIYAIATHLCFDKLKSSKRMNKTLEMDERLNNLISSENLEQQIIDKELGQMILALTQKLTPKQRLVFTLRDLEALEVEEIIRMTGLTANKIKSNLFLARQTIRNKLKSL